jgi:MFS family permease
MSEPETSSKKPRIRGIYVPLLANRIRPTRKVTLLLGVALAGLLLLVFAALFNRVGEPALDKQLIAQAGTSLITSVGILAAASVALMSFYLDRFFGSVEPMIEKMEPSIQREFLARLPESLRKKFSDLEQAGTPPLGGPEFVPYWVTAAEQALENTRKMVQSLMAYPGEIRRDVILTLGLLVSAIVFSELAILVSDASLIGLSIGLLIGGSVALVGTWADAQRGLEDWLHTASVFRIVMRRWSGNGGVDKA